MATIKSFTDISQSRKLAEILPLESADTIWDLTNSNFLIIRTIPYEDSDYNNKYLNIIPAWSLAALLGVLPNENMLVKTTNSEYYCIAIDVTTKHYNNPVDACYELILKLKELNLL